MKMKEPHSGAFDEFVVKRKAVHHRHYSGPDGGSHVVALKESGDPNKLTGEKSLLSGLLVEFSALAKALSQRK